MAAGERCVIYVRVSTEDQVTGTSLQTQEQACRDFAAREGWPVARVYRDAGESAKTDDRPAFQEMIAHCSARAHRIARIVVWKLDRFARNSDDAGHYRRGLRMASGTMIVSATEHLSADPAGNFLRTMLEGQAQYDNEVRSQRAVAAMQSLQMAGYWTHQAPIGYVAARDAGKPVLQAHPVAGPAIAQVFAAVAAGTLSPAGVVAELERRRVRSRGGRKITLARVHEMLRDPIYAGRIVTRWTRGQSVRAAFPALVEDLTFDRVQLVLDGKSRASAPKRAVRPDFPLRGFVRCGTCDTPMTSAYSRGRSGRYGYYECHHRCADSRGRKEEIEQQFLALLGGLRDQYQPLLALFRAVVADVWQQHNHTHVAARREAEAAMEKIETRRARLLDALLDGTIAETTYKAREDAMQAELARHRVAAACEQPSADPAQALLAADYALRDPAGLWLRLDPANKARFEVALYRDGLQWSRGGGLRTVGSGCLFEVLQPARFALSEVAPPSGFTSNPVAIVQHFEPLIWLVAA